MRTSQHGLRCNLRKVAPVTHSQVAPVTHSQVAPVTHSQVAPVTHSQVAPVTHSQVAPVTHSQVAPVTHTCRVCASPTSTDWHGTCFRKRRQPARGPNIYTHSWWRWLWYLHVTSCHMHHAATSSRQQDTSSWQQGTALWTACWDPGFQRSMGLRPCTFLCVLSLAYVLHACSLLKAEQSMVLASSGSSKQEAAWANAYFWHTHAMAMTSIAGHCNSTKWALAFQGCAAIPAPEQSWHTIWRAYPTRGVGTTSAATFITSAAPETRKPPDASLPGCHRCSRTCGRRFEHVHWGRKEARAQRWGRGEGAGLGEGVGGGCWGRACSILIEQLVATPRRGCRCDAWAKEWWAREEHAALLLSSLLLNAQGLLGLHVWMTMRLRLRTQSGVKPHGFCCS